MIATHCGGEIVLRDITSDEAARVQRELTLANPRYAGAVRAGKTPYGVPPTVCYAHVGSGSVAIPAAAIHCCPDIAVDRSVSSAVAAQFQGDLRIYQVAAVARIIRERWAILEAPTGSGKTTMACAVTAERGERTLVLVHSRVLLSQWEVAIQRWLGNGDAADVLVINTAATRIPELADQYGQVIVDECHRVAGERYQTVLRGLHARYRLGLSATPYRSDSLTPLVQWTLGDIITVPRAPLVASGSVLPPEITQVPTAYASDIDGSAHYAALMSELVDDGERNDLVAQIARDSSAVTIVLTDRLGHCEELGARLPGAVVLHGQLGRGAHRRALAAIQGAQCIIATAQIIGEGFDLPRAERLILATPMSFRGRLIQAIGRVLRPCAGKTHGQIIDICDWHVPVLAGAARRRQRVYRALTQGG